MDILLDGILSFPPTEYKKFRSVIRRKAKAYQLVTFLRKNGKMGIKVYDKAMQELGYSENRGAFYILKHRTAVDFISFKTESGMNDLVKTRVGVWNLRLMLYNRGYNFIDKELNRLLANCIKYSLFNEEAEIYFILLLQNNNNIKEIIKYKKLVKETQEKQSTFLRLEMLFYHLMFELENWFYNSTSNTYADNRKLKASIYKEIEQLHSRIKTPISLFFFLSSKLDLNLRLHSNDDLKWTEIEKDIDSLIEVYTEPSVFFRIPNCQLGIQSIISKYYLIKGDKLKFVESTKSLSQYIDSVKGLSLYSNVFLYYIFSSLYMLVIEKSGSKMDSFLRKNFDENIYNNYTERVKFLYHHYLSIACIYKGNLNKAISELMKARTFSKVIHSLEKTILLENSFLVIMIYLIKDELKLLLYEDRRIKALLRELYPNSFEWKFISKELKKIALLPSRNRKFELYRLVDLMKEKHNLFLLLDTTQLEHYYTL